MKNTTRMEVIVKSERDGQEVTAKVEATVATDKKTVTIEIKKYVGGTADGTLWSVTTKVTGATGDSAVTIDKITLDGEDSPNTNITTGAVTLTAKVTGDAGSTKTLTLSAKVPLSGNSGRSEAVPITVTATVKPGQASKYNVTITATIKSAYSGTIMIYKHTITELPGTITLTKDESEGTITVQSTGGTPGKTTETLTKERVIVEFKSVNPTNLGNNATYTYRTFYPDYGHYISKVVGTKVSAPLWDTQWDGGECEYAEYYERTTTVGGTGNTVALAVVYVRILGGLDIRYFGTNNVNTNTTGGWKIIDSKTFYTNLEKLRGTEGLNLGGTAQSPDASNNLVKGTPTSEYNTEYKMVFPSPVWLPLIMQGLSVGAVGSIFPNLIPKDFLHYVPLDRHLKS